MVSHIQSFIWCSACFPGVGNGLDGWIGKQGDKGTDYVPMDGRTWGGCNDERACFCLYYKHLLEKVVRMAEWTDGVFIAMHGKDGSVMGMR